MTDLTWVDVESSTIKSIAYDSENNCLYVRFVSGAEYRYLNVPYSVYKKFEEAPSKGVYLNSAIKENYSFEKTKPSLIN